MKIFNNLFLGSDHECKTGNFEAIIHACKTCHQKALNYTKSLPSSHPNYLIFLDKDHLHLNLVDMPREFSPLYTNPIMKAAIRFIESNISSKQILIHCNQGMSRSPSIAMLYLAKKSVISKVSYDEAKKDFVKIYNQYLPGNGIEIYMRRNWEQLVSL